MSLRTKLVAGLVFLVALATVSIGWFSYRATASRLDAEVDRSLAETVQTLQVRPDLDDRTGRDTRLGGHDLPPSYGLVEVQVLRPDGTASASSTTGGLPVDAQEATLARAGAGPALYRTFTTTGGERYRMVTAPFFGDPGAIQVARSLAENGRLLDSLRNRTILAVVLVVVGAALLGWLVARRLTRRLVRLTSAAEEVEATGRLDVDVPVQGQDEAGRLGAAFNGMLAALARSKDDQQRLVQDAGHELRTPLTSLRTNISVLRHYDRLSEQDRGHLLDDLDSETRELTDMVNELVELATETRGDEPEETVVLGELARRVAMRAQRRSGRTVTVDADASTVRGRPLALERALSNLLDNTAKFDPGQRAHRGGGPPRPGRSPRPRPRARPGRRGPRVRPLLPSGGGAEPPGLGPRPLHRASGGRGPRRHGLRGEPAWWGRGHRVQPAAVFTGRGGCEGHGHQRAPAGGRRSAGAASSQVPLDRARGERRAWGRRAGRSGRHDAVAASVHVGLVAVGGPVVLPAPVVEQVPEAVVAAALE